MIINKMFAVQEMFPNMRWDFNEYGGISFHIYGMDEEDLKFLAAGRQMFEPAD